jgi:hypothetical protein
MANCLYIRKDYNKKENTMSDDTPFINDAITSDDAGFSSDAGNIALEESAPVEDSFSEEPAEAQEEASGEPSGEGVQAETKEELKEEIEEAIEEGATDEEVANMIREYTLKVNGKEKKVKLDLSNEEDLIRRLQLAEASQLAMQERRELEKTYESEVKRLMEDPFGMLEELGLDPVKLAEQRLRAEVEERKKSPELREKERIERELAEARAELRRQQEEAENARMTQLEQEAAKELNDEIQKALDAHPKLPRSKKTVTRIADHLLWAMENADDLGIDPDSISVEDVIPSVEKEIRDELQEFMKELPEDVMEEYIGQQNLERMRKKRLSAHKTEGAKDVKPTVKSVAPKETKESKKKVKSKDYFKNLGR